MARAESPDVGALSPGVVILAAGRSRRMGRPKLLLPWNSGTILEHHFAIWRTLDAAQVCIVIDPANATVCDELDRLVVPSSRRILNPDPDAGMFGSVKRAADWNGWAPEIDSWVIVLGDQPQIEVDLLERLLNFHRAHPEDICQPESGGMPRHPVILPRWAWRLLSSTTAPTLREFLEAHSDRRRTLQFGADYLEMDIDTPSDYLALRPSDEGRPA